MIAVVVMKKNIEYKVIIDGKIVKRFSLFHDAWLYSILECSVWTKIVGPDGEWKINPLKAN